jgi:hypothetical protein
MINDEYAAFIVRTYKKKPQHFSRGFLLLLLSDAQAAFLAFLTPFTAFLATASKFD